MKVRVGYPQILFNCDQTVEYNMTITNSLSYVCIHSKGTFRLCHSIPSIKYGVYWDCASFASSLMSATAEICCSNSTAFNT
jgi:hypothetical protein